MSKKTTTNEYQPRKAIPLEKGKSRREDGMEYGRMHTVSRLTKGGQRTKASPKFRTALQ